MEAPRTLSEELISSVMTSYEKMNSSRPRVHELLYEMNFMHGFEEKIKDLILKYTTHPDTDTLPQSTYVGPERRRRSIKPEGCIIA